MRLLTSHAKYIKDHLPSLDPEAVEPEKEDLKAHNFFIKFGFKRRVTGESHFRLAVETIYTHEQTHPDHKEYLEEEYIEDDFECLATTILDEYWLSVQRDAATNELQKRKAENLELEITPRRSAKDRRLSTTLTANNITDLSNAGPSGHSHLLSFKTTKPHTPIVSGLDPLLNQALIDLFSKKMPISQRYKESLKLILYCKNEDTWFFKLLSHIIEVHEVDPDLFIVTNIQNYSEKDLDIKLWGRVFIFLFSDYKFIKIKGGERQLEGSTFKLDYKIGFYIKNHFIDVSNVEVGRSANNTKVKDDHNKLLIEAKTIINSIIKKYSFIHPNSIPIPSLQICGLKGDLLTTTLQTKKKYISSRSVERIRTPLSPNDADATINYIKHLIHWKEQVVDAATMVLKLVNEADDRRSSFGKTLKPKTRNKESTYVDWLDDNIIR